MGGGPGSPLWPRLLAFLLVALIAGAGGIALGRGETPIDWFESARTMIQGDETSPPVASVPSASDATDADQNAQPAAQGDLAANPDGAAEVPLDSEASDDPGPAPEGDAAQIPDEEAEPEPQEEQEAPEIATATEAVQRFSELWSAADYEGMYALLSEDAQASISLQEFVDRYTGITAEAGVTEVTVTLNGDADLNTTVPVTVKMVSSKVGDIEQENQIPVLKEGEEWRIAWTPSLIFSQLGNDCIDFIVESVDRGSILDRDGDPLAYQAIVYEIGIIPGSLENETQTLAQLSRLIDMSSTAIRDKYKDGDPAWFMPITTVPDPVDSELLNSISQMPGVAMRERSARVYPLGAAAAHITGYVTPVNADDLAADAEGELDAAGVLGRAGIEAAANDILAGKPGGRLSVVKCATRLEQDVIAQRRSVPPQDLILTIDDEFQKTVDKVLGEVSGSAVILDPRDGSVLAMVSHPTFDPNAFVRGLTSDEVEEIYDEAKRPLLNRATQQGYPTGSIFKVITMSAAMRHLGYNAESIVECPQEWSIPDTDLVWRDWTYEYGVGAQGTMNLHAALVNSCNTVFYELGYELDREDENHLPNMTKAFGLGAPTGIPYVQEIGGAVPSPEWKLEQLDDYWATGDAVNLSIGQGYLLATPLQMANAYAAIANGGEVLQPFIVKATRKSDGSSQTVGERTVIKKLPLNSRMIAEIQTALRDQTSNAAGAGSAQVFGDFGWPIAGKTGTAQNQSGRNQKPHSWFAAFGPYGEEAEITSIVMVESSGEGVSFAAPRTREIYTAWLDPDAEIRELPTPDPGDDGEAAPEDPMASSN
jgi:penicillin-binding protein 2